MKKMHSFHLRYIHLALLVCLLFKRKSDCEVSEIRLYYEADLTHYLDVKIQLEQVLYEVSLKNND